MSMRKRIRMGERRIAGLVVAVLLLAGIGGGGIWFWISINPSGGTAINDDLKNLDEFEDMDFDYTEACSQLTASRTMEGYWDCLETNAFFLTSSSFADIAKKRSEGMENPFNNLKNWQVRKPNQEWNKPPYKEQSTSRRTKRRKRSLTQDNNFKPGPYKPAYTNFTLKSRPYSPKYTLDKPPFSYNDYYYKYVDWLYTFDAANFTQKQPPWSYDGEFGQKNWHNLEIEKFLVPLRPTGESKLAQVLKASLNDHWSEYQWTNFINGGPQFAAMFIAYRNSIFGNGVPIPEYIARINPANSSETEKLRSLIPNDPNLGYYSAFRFLLPPPPPLNELKEFEKMNLLPKDFTLPNAINNDQYRNLAKAFENIYYRFENRSATQNEFDQLRDWIGKAEPFLYINGVDVTNFTAQDVVKNMVELAGKFDKEKVNALKDRSQLSLPILPHPYPICQQQEPSPLDIQDEFSTISSIRPYEFDKNFYKMYRLRMFFPEDGTNILGVGLETSDPMIGRAIGLSGGATGGVKLFMEIMFIHVGKTETTGTEHKLQGKGYAMELQLLFTYRGRDRDESQPYYETLARQQNDLFPFRGKVALMLALLVEVKPDDEVRDKFLFEPLTQLAYKFREQEERERGGKNRSRAFTTSQYAFRLSDFIPSDAQFYTYRGGLTFPPCFGYVTWSVYNKTLHITKSQFREFQFIPALGEDSEYLAGNVREIDSEWVEAENTVNIPPAEKKKLKDIRTHRTLLKSLDPKLYGVKGNESHYDYYYDYDEASSPFISKILIALLPTTLITLFYI